jgi:hypothetical protein
MHEVWLLPPLNKSFLLTLEDPCKIQTSSNFGGVPNLTLNVSIMNDTGSNLQTIFLTDLAALQYNANTYTGHLGLVGVDTANGHVFRQQLIVEMQIIGNSLKIM